MTPVQFGVLAQLAATPELLQAELARSVLIRPQSMAAVITQLVDRGLLERRGTGGRGRPVPIRLTDEGRQLLGQASAAVRRYNEPATLGLESYEAGMLNALLHKVIDAHTGNS
nr:MarR family winged helix-turn-helix transcriptional regulator [Kibdelosporangium phytohabitans]